MRMKLWRRSLAALSGATLLGSLLTAALPLAASAESDLWHTSGSLTVSVEGALTADAAGTAIYDGKIDWVQEDTVSDFDGGLTFTFDESYWSDPQWFDLHISAAPITEESFTVQDDGHRYLPGGDTYFLRPYVEDGTVKVENKLFRSGTQHYATTTVLTGFTADKPITFALWGANWRSLVAVQNQQAIPLNGNASGIGTGTDYAAVSVAGAFSGVTVTAPTVPEWELQGAAVTGTAADGFSIEAQAAFAARYNTRMDLRDGVNFQINSQNSWVMIAFGESKDAISFGAMSSPVPGKASKTVMLRNQDGKVHVSLWNGSVEVINELTGIDASASHNLKMLLGEDNYYRLCLDGQLILAADATPAESFQVLNGYDAGTDTWRGGYVQFSSDNAASISGVKSATEIPEELPENTWMTIGGVTLDADGNFQAEQGGCAFYTSPVDLVQEADAGDTTGGLAIALDETYMAQPKWFAFHVSTTPIEEDSFEVREDGHRYLKTGWTYYLRASQAEDGRLQLEHQMYLNGISQYGPITTNTGFDPERPFMLALQGAGWRSLAAVQDEKPAVLNDIASGTGTGTDYIAVSVAEEFGGMKLSFETPSAPPVEPPVVDENWTAKDASVTGSLADGYTIQGDGELAARYNLPVDLLKGIDFRMDSLGDWVMIGFGESADAMTFGTLTNPVEGKVSRTVMLRNQDGKVHVSLWTGAMELVPELTGIDAAGTHTLKMLRGGDGYYRFCLDGQQILSADALSAENFQTLNGYDAGTDTWRGGYVQFSAQKGMTLSGVKPSAGEPEVPEPTEGWVTSEGVSISETGVLKVEQAGTAWTATKVDTLVDDNDYEGGLSFLFNEDYLRDPQWFNLHISNLPITENSFVSGNAEAGHVEGERYLAQGWSYRIRVRKAEIGTSIDCNLYINGTLVLPKTVDIMNFLPDQPITFALRGADWRSIVAMQGTAVQILGGEASGVGTGNDYVGLSFAGLFTGATVTFEVPEFEPEDTGWESGGVYIDGSEDEGFRLLTTEAFAARYNTGVDLARGFAFHLESVGDWFMLGIGESKDALSMSTPVTVQEGKTGYAMLMRNMDGKLYVALFNGTEYAMQTYPTIQALGSHSVKLMADEVGNYHIYIDGQQIIPGLSIPPEEFNRLNGWNEAEESYNGGYVWLAGWTGGATITGFKPFRPLDPSETENNSEDWYTESACIINDGDDGSYSLTLDAFSSARFIGQMDMAQGFVMQLDLSEGLGGSFGFGLGQKADTLTLDVPPVPAQGSYSAVYRMRVIDENTLEILLPDGTSVQMTVDLSAAHTYSLMQDGRNYRLAIDGKMIEGDVGLDLLTYALVNNGGVGSYLTLFAQDRTTFTTFKPLAVYVDTDDSDNSDDSDDSDDWDSDDSLLPDSSDEENPVDPSVPDTGVAAVWPAALVLAAVSVGVLLRSRRRTGSNR